jgi:hypothetical protein
MGEHGLFDVELAEMIRRESAAWSAQYGVRSHPRQRALRSSAIQLGMLVDLGAIVWDPRATTADGRSGALVIDFTRLADAQTEIARRLVHVVMTSDWPALQELVARYIEGSILPREMLEQRFGPQRYPRRVFAIDW